MQAALALWICGCAYLNCVGWLLSACHQLNPVGYGIVLLPGFVALFIWRKNNPQSVARPNYQKKIFKRFRRLFPALFLLVTILIFLGGVLYAPSNFDALTYRLPRLLNWLSAGHWFWIPTINDRMNYSGVAWEWTALPLLALTHSDRILFLINALGFLFLPGLLFSIFRQLGVARKVAWTWMWLLPLAYGYVTQAGSIGNDFTGTLFFLAAIYFGLRARRSGRVGDVWLSLLAAVLMTGVKLSNLPLALPCLVAVGPALGLLRKNLVAGLAVAGIAVLVSAAPMMLANQLNAGSWNADPQNKSKMQVKNPVAALLGNSLLIAEQSFTPPVFPGSGKFTDRLNASLPGSWKSLLQDQFPRFYQTKINEIPGEESAGLGIVIALPLVLVLLISLARIRRVGGEIYIFSLLPPVALAAWVSVLFYMAKMGSESAPRLLLPYYPLAVIPFLLLPAQGWLLRQKWWRVFLALMMLSVLPVIILSVARPLWPAQTISRQLASAHPQNKMLQRMATTYATYAHRNDFLAPIRAALPADATKIGFIASSNDSDYSLWQPVGRRRVTDLLADPGHFLAQPATVEWLVVKQSVWPELTPVPLEIWAQENHATIVLSLPLTELVSWGPENWCLLHFEKPAAPPITSQ